MATTTTPRQILAIAYPKSVKNSPGQLATESVELLGVVNRAVRALFSAAARINPQFFAKRAVLAPALGKWRYPEDAESVYALRRGAESGAEVVVVPGEDLDAEQDMPRVYFEGMAYWPASEDVDGPTALESLAVRYARQPVDAATLDATLDADWPEQFNELLGARVALYLAVKDGRAEEVESLRADIAEQAKLFVAHLEHAVPNIRRRYGHVPRINTTTMVTVQELLGLAAPASA